jgi:hypothetical protein
LNSPRSSTYRIRIAGQLDARWAAWFDDLTITLDEGDTLLTGPVVDQAALHGLLRRVRDLGVTLVSVTTVDRRPTETPSHTMPRSRQVLRSAESRTPPTEKGRAEDEGR